MNAHESLLHARRQVGAQIRTMHRYGFRSGAWAKITAYSEDADGPCWLVEFPDGVTDWWRCDDADAQYEIRESVCSCGYAHEDYCGDQNICRHLDDDFCVPTFATGVTRIPSASPIPTSVPTAPAAPIFPLATLADLQAELADTDRALDRLGSGLVVDHDQLLARRERLMWWRRRIAQQINDTENA